MAEEERDIYFGTPPQIVEFAKKLVPKMAGMMALMAKAVYEKYGEEAIEVIAEEVRKDAREKGKKFREEAGYKPEEVNVEIALKEIYAKSHGALAAAGLDLRRIRCDAQGSESHVHYCGLCEGWKTKWDKVWYLCYIFSTIHDVGFMEGVNPKLKWVAHAEPGPDKFGKEQLGLAHGSDHPCIMKLKLMEE